MLTEVKVESHSTRSGRDDATTDTTTSVINDF
jgi:hypothetical protein